jgi:GntR family transcriptional repressor for pyruvate dehydrogenase complex
MHPPKDSSAEKISDRVAVFMTRYIRDHRLRPGSSVPSELQISAELGVSRGIIREAYRTLSATGVLDTANGRAPRVGHLNTRALAQFLDHALSTEQASALEVLELRSPIEVRAAELAAQMRSAVDVDAIYREVSIMAAVETWEGFADADVRYHAVISRATGNRLFGVVGSALSESFVLSIRTGVRYRASRPELQMMAEIHAVVADAIAASDPDRAGQAMRRHFDEARVGLLRLQSADHLTDGPSRLSEPTTAEASDE